VPREICLRRALASGRLAAVSATLGAGRLHAAAADELPPLNDPPAADRLTRKFVGAHRFPTDPAITATFYGILWGGTGRTIARDSPSYLILYYEDRPLAGMVPRPLRNGPPPRGA
jgi:hypothetical protein